ncbi:cytokine-dependent hematopoietic cell linker isoform X1 [Scophthalmus maximus]|uniref:cytokine-dependent hematopoietic cell linker isoform X1 n=1 Tax=Scophthalmus maximus TaxID=52904 RepID=UPI001FA90976|nr:cytokine-dependent hematopoietic cell linker isoform X1 [Scophthalmus maximus]
MSHGCGGCPFAQDRGRRTDVNRNQRCGNHGGVMESEYDIVDDQEEVLNVRILPARPMHEEMEYADRVLPRSSSAQSLPSISTGNSNILPRCPPRVIPHTGGPAVNRDMKPGRRKTIIGNGSTPVLPGVQCSLRRPPSPPLPLVDQLPGSALRRTCRRNGQQNANRKAGFSSHATGQQRAESVSGAHSNHRRSLDLDSHIIEIRSQNQNLERVPSGRHHHEWPQTKDDFDQHDFVPKEKPQLTDSEEDWYVGACSRADAEHALHLVNKDGAFLVRDCSINSDSEPLVLAVYHEKKVYNVKIRFLESTSKFALGTGQRSNDMFDSVADILKFHTIFPIMLISGRFPPGSKHPENCVLTCAVTRTDVEQLLQ